MTPFRLFLLIVLAGAIITVTVPLAKANEMTIGIQDQGADQQALITNARLLGADTIRIIAKPGQPHLDQVTAYRQAGFKVQAAIVVKRQTTSQDIMSLIRSWRGMVQTVSVGNEPELNGLSACAYARMFRKVQTRIRRMGITLGFGEFSPAMAFEYIDQIARCHVRIRADFTAVHPYQFFSDPLARPFERSGVGTWLGMGNLGDFRRALRRHALPHQIRATEFSYLTTGPYRISADRAASYWPRAVKQARKWADQLVIYGLGEVHDSSTWGSASLLDRFGLPTAAYRALAKALGRVLPPDQVPPPVPSGDLVSPPPDLEPVRPALIPAQVAPEVAQGASQSAPQDPDPQPVVIEDPPIAPQYPPPPADDPPVDPTPTTPDPQELTP